MIHSPGSSGSWSVPRVTMVLESLGLLTSRQHLQLLLARCLARRGPSGGQAGGAGPEAGTSPPRQTSATSGVPMPQKSDQAPAVEPALPVAKPPLRPVSPQGDGASTHAAPSTSSPGWSEVAVATPTYVIHPVRLQVCGGNGAILEVSLGSFLIISMASRQCTQPGHAPRHLGRAPS